MVIVALADQTDRRRCPRSLPRPAPRRFRRRLRPARLVMPKAVSRGPRLRRDIEKGAVGGVGAGPAALDVVDPQTRPAPWRSACFVSSRELHALASAARPAGWYRRGTGVRGSWHVPSAFSTGAIGKGPAGARPSPSRRRCACGSTERDSRQPVAGGTALARQKCGINTHHANPSGLRGQLGRQLRNVAIAVVTSVGLFPTECTIPMSQIGFLKIDTSLSPDPCFASRPQSHLRISFDAQSQPHRNAT